MKVDAEKKGGQRAGDQDNCQNKNRGDGLDGWKYFKNNENIFARRFEECFGYVVENILLTKEEFINEIIKKSERLKQFIEKTKVHSEHLYILLSRVI